MSDPQNLNQTSPGALSTGAPPVTELPLNPVAPTLSTASGAPAPPTVSDGTTVPPTTTTANSGPAPSVLGRAGTGAPAQPAGAAALPGQVIGSNNSGGSASTGGAFQGPIVNDAADLTAALAATVPPNGQALAAVGSQPACDANHRGGTMTVFATAGVGDSLQVCMKGTADTYAWRTAFTAP